MKEREHKMTDLTTSTGELSLQEMLGDPIVQTMMDRDGITKQDVENLFETVREKMAGRCLAKREAGYHKFDVSALEG